MSSGWSLGSIEQRHLAEGVSTVLQQARRTKEDDKLHALLQHSIRQYLLDRNIIPACDSSSSMMSILETRPSRVSSSSSSRIDGVDGEDAMAVSLSKFGQNLFALNGFEEVPVPCSTKDRLRLAEGVVATPTVDPQIAKSRSLRQRRRRYGGGGGDSSHGADGEYTSVTWMFSRKHDQQDTLSASSSSNASIEHINSKFPLIVQEDIQLYRILENQATFLLDRWYDRITSWYERKIKLPYQIQVLRLKNVLDDVGDKFIWIYRQVRSGHLPSSSPPKEIPTQRVKSSPEEIVKIVYDDDDDRHNNGIDKGVDRMSTVTIDSNLKNMENSIAMKDESGMIEDLLVIHAVSFTNNNNDSNNNSKRSGRIYYHKGNNNDDDTDNNTDTVPTLTLYTEMTPSTRIVALPHYTLGPSSASTLVSISLVVFGAIPLAYRSLKFMYDYPAYANIIAASVLLSISYGIWSQRSSAWTNQSYVVSNAMWHRLQGRDEAVVLSLKESAIDRVCEAVLDEYYRYQLPVFFPSKDCPWEQTVPELETPLQIAVDLGLIRPKDDDNVTGISEADPHQGPTQWKSVKVEDALQKLP